MNSFESLQALFDYYALRARVMPVLILCLSSAAWLSHLTSGGSEGSGWPDALSIALAVCVVVILGEYVRERGKETETRLFKEWGDGTKPAAVLLRHSGGLDKVLREGYIENLQARIPSIKFPSEAEELSDPKAADAVYSRAIAWLRENTRGNDYSLILRESGAYGFRRNLFAIRKELFSVNIISLLAGLISIFFDISFRQGFGSYLRDALYEAMLQEASFWFAMFTSLLTLLCAALLVTKTWVKQASDEYSWRLLAACNTLGSAAPAAASP